MADEVRKKKSDGSEVWSNTIDGDVIFGSFVNTPNLWWDNGNKKLKTRSLILEEAGDAIDLALLRHGGSYPDGARVGLGDGETIGRIYMVPFDGTAYQCPDGAGSSTEGPVAQMYAKTAGVPSQTSRPGDWHIATTPIGAVMPVDRIVIKHNGNMLFGADSSMQTACHYAFQYADSSKAAMMVWNPAASGGPIGLVVLTGQNGGFAPKFAVGTGSYSSYSTEFKVQNDGRTVFTVPNGAINDGDLSNSRASFYLDEGNNTLRVKVRYANGTVKTGAVTLS